MEKRNIEEELRTLLAEYLEKCRENRSISFQGSVAEMAWEIEHHTEFITDDVC